MIETQLLVPTDIIKQLSKRFAFAAKDGEFGYYGVFTPSEIMTIVAALLKANYRVDITPGESFKLMARKI